MPIFVKLCQWTIPFVQYSFSSKMYPFINYSHTYTTSSVIYQCLLPFSLPKTYWNITYTKFFLKWKCSILSQSILAINPSIYTHKHTTHCKYIFVHSHLLFNKYLLSIYYVPRIALEAENKTNILALVELTVWTLVHALAIIVSINVIQ